MANGDKVAPGSKRFVPSAHPDNQDKPIVRVPMGRMVVENDRMGTSQTKINPDDIKPIVFRGKDMNVERAFEFVNADFKRIESQIRAVDGSRNKFTVRVKRVEAKLTTALSRLSKLERGLDTPTHKLQPKNIVTTAPVVSATPADTSDPSTAILETVGGLAGLKMLKDLAAKVASSGGAEVAAEVAGATGAAAAAKSKPGAGGKLAKAGRFLGKVGGGIGAALSVYDAYKDLDEEAQKEGGWGGVWENIKHPFNPDNAEPTRKMTDEEKKRLAEMKRKNGVPSYATELPDITVTPEDDPDYVPKKKNGSEDNNDIYLGSPKVSKITLEAQSIIFKGKLDLSGAVMASGNFSKNPGGFNAPTLNLSDQQSAPPGFQWGPLQAAPMPGFAPRGMPALPGMMPSFRLGGRRPGGPGVMPMAPIGGRPTQFNPSMMGPQGNLISGIPGEGNFANKSGVLGQHGDESQLTWVTTNKGSRVQVNKAVAGNYLGFLNELEASGYDIKSLGGYNNRANVNNPRAFSEHAYGNAIDINPGANPNRSQKTNLPDGVNEMANKYGLTWGRSFNDPMHFEYHSKWKVPMQGIDEKGNPVQMSGPGATPGTGGDGSATQQVLSSQRSRFKDELQKDPDLRMRWGALMMSEQSGKARTTVGETMTNRANAWGQPLSGIVDNKVYYQPYQDGSYYKNYKLLKSNPELQKQVFANQEEIMSGSNRANFGTHNASAGVAANAQRQQTVTAIENGETYTRKDINPDLHGEGIVKKEGNWFKKTSSDIKELEAHPDQSLRPQTADIGPHAAPPSAPAPQAASAAPVHGLHNGPHKIGSVKHDIEAAGPQPGHQGYGSQRRIDASLCHICDL